MIKVWSFLFEDNISVNEALMQVLTKAIYATELQPSYNSWVIPEHVKEALTRGNMVEDPWYFRSNARFSLELSSVQPDSSNFHHTQEFSEQVLSKCEKITRICQSFKEILLSLDLDEDIESNEAVQSIRSKIASYLPIVTNYIEIFQEHNGDVLDTALKTNDMIKDVQDYYVSLVEEMMVAKAMADSLSDPNVQVDTDIYPDCSASFEIENNWTSSSRSKEEDAVIESTEKSKSEKIGKSGKEKDKKKGKSKDSERERKEKKKESKGKSEDSDSEKKSKRKKQKEDELESENLDKNEKKSKKVKVEKGKGKGKDLENTLKPEQPLKENSKSSIEDKSDEEVKTNEDKKSTDKKPPKRAKDKTKKLSKIQKLALQKSNKVNSCISYLSEWKHSRETWKFQKSKQLWLIRSIYDVEKIDDSNFAILKEYIKSIQGNFRNIIKSNAEKVIEENSKNDQSTDGDNKSDSENQSSNKTDDSESDSEKSSEDENDSLPPKGLKQVLIERATQVIECLKE
ncbi:hypothetical protein BB560_004645 [Smittium megazygosporum]|uniref:WKF domain-containing protein n=1 Tax=Smittium megazygosporum TaxID=133381 RepID=A0A2T9Z8S3_9FUNG|nr:hypothetical protein BB560_004645 [Smittium megazygosporum]